MSVWDVKHDSERVPWTFVPLVSVGPLRFGAGHDEVVAALGGVAPGSGVGDPHTTGWSEARFTEWGVTVYYSDRRLHCVAVDGLRGPQVTFEGAPLTGRAPSAVERWMIDHARLSGRELRYTHEGDAELGGLGLVARAQRAGDVLVSRPVFLDRRIDVTWDEVPGNEWDVH